MNGWNEFLTWIKDNKDSLSWLFGSGVVLVIGGAIYQGIRWVFKQWRIRKLRSDENFPFKVILPNSNVAKEILGGGDTDLLADRNIPYQQRVTNHNTRREIEDLLSLHQWVLIKGKTGLGKTREAINVAESLNKEGWTILHLTRDRWLSAPSKLPTGVPERKLLFILDDLNRKIYASHVEQSPSAGENLLQPFTVPFQDRLLETLQTFEALCGKKEVLVIATARDEQYSEFVDEPSEWDKLEISKFNNFWKRFIFYSLPEAEDAAEIRLLEQSTKLINVKVLSTDFEAIARHNDGTFANLVENIRTACNQRLDFNLSNFRDTLKGTWEKRYLQVTRKYPEAKYIYDAIELLRDIRLELSRYNVINVAVIVSQKKSPNILQKWKISRVFNYLVKTEGILSPRDGQIEVKGYRANLSKFISYLYPYVLSKFYSDNLIDKVGIFIMFLVVPKKYFFKKKFSTVDFLLSIIIRADLALELLGVAYINLGLVDPGVSYLKQSIKLNSPSGGKWLHKLIYKRLANSWKNLGVQYFKIGQIKNSVDAHRQAVKINPNDGDSWYFLGKRYSYLGQHNEAIEAYNKAIILQPKDTSPWLGLGDLYSELKLYDEALSSHLTAIALKPKDGESWAHLAEFYRYRNRYRESLEAVHKAVDVDPKSAHAWNTLGNIYSDQNYLEEAINAYSKAIELKDHYIYRCNLGIVYFRKGWDEEALHSFTQALKLNEKSVYAHISLATYYIKKSQLTNANSHIHDAEQLLINSIYYYNACLASIKNNRDEAFYYLEISIKRHDTSIAWIRHDPNFDFIRDDSRFEKLVGENSKSNVANSRV